MESEADNDAGLGCMGARHGSGIAMDDKVGMDNKVSMGTCAGGAFAEEEDGGYWLINRLSIFRRRRSSLVVMEAWVTGRLAMAASRRSKHFEKSLSSAIEALNENTKLL